MMHPMTQLRGYIIHESGRIPGVNEELLLGVHKIIISKASPSRIKTVRLEILPEELS
jgi:putative hemolysin